MSCPSYRFNEFVSCVKIRGLCFRKIWWYETRNGRRGLLWLKVFNMRIVFCGIKICLFRLSRLEFLQKVLNGGSFENISPGCYLSFFLFFFFVDECTFIALGRIFCFYFVRLSRNIMRSFCWILSESEKEKKMTQKWQGPGFFWYPGSRLEITKWPNIALARWVFFWDATA